MCLYPGLKHMCLYPVDIYQSATKSLSFRITVVPLIVSQITHTQATFVIKLRLSLWRDWNTKFGAKITQIIKILDVNFTYFYLLLTSCHTVANFLYLYILWWLLEISICAYIRRFFTMKNCKILIVLAISTCVYIRDNRVIYFFIHLRVAYVY